MPLPVYSRVEAKGLHDVSSLIVFPLSDRISQWAQSSLKWLAWLPSEPQTTSWLSLSPIPALGLHTHAPHTCLCVGTGGSEVSSCLHSKHTNHGAMSCSELVFLIHRFQNLFPLVLNSARKQRVGVKENGFPGLNHFQTSPRSDKFLSNWK